MKALLFGLFALLAPVSIAPVCGQANETNPASASKAPRLIVILAVDQLIPEQMDRLKDSFKGGLARIRNQGARFDGAAMPYSSSETGPGHATIATGCLPKTHGIIGNGMRSRRLGHTIYCVADPAASTVTSFGQDEPGSYSAKNILKPCLGDYLKEANPESKVFAVSVKDRAAVSMAGHRGDGSFWWDSKRGGFISSTAFSQELPAYVNEYNKGWAEVFSGLVWKPVFSLENLPKETEKDDREGESGFGGQGRVFPYTFAGTVGEAPTGSALTELAGQVGASPMGDRVTLELAAKIVINEGLGLDDVPDFLGVSLSAPDKVGHSFGPYSMEVTDTLLRMDLELEILFALLDERVGKDRWVLAMTADHGVLPLPEGEHALVKGAGQQRIGKEGLTQARKDLDAALVDAFGADSKGRGLKLHFGRGDIYLDQKDLAKRTIDPAQARFVAAASLESADWIQKAYTLEELSSTEATSDPYLIYYRNAYSAEYSPDVAVLPKRGTLVGWKQGTTHGSAYAYDRSLPLYFMGPGFERGNHDGSPGSHDILPTLLSLVGLVPKGLDGQVLHAVFAEKK
ncbi:MAG: putative AlkP superfamily pyrophosphatase or phosphodiesterase [Planctomycetota bacterium]|jgi:predicted AlkP superfamily pyrophosphatase or phosphodiesterase